MPTCPSCGAEVQPDARFCPQCAAPVSSDPAPVSGSPAPAEPGGHSPADPPAPASPPSGGHGGLTEHNWAVLAHLSALAPLVVGLPLTFLGPLVMWLLARDRGPHARDQATEALNFNISWLVWGLVLLIAGVALSVPTVGIAIFPALLLLGALAIAWLILVIIAAVRAAGGETFRYPLTIRFLAG